jgi:hypothetical protein
LSSHSQSLFRVGTVPKFVKEIAEFSQKIFLRKILNKTTLPPVSSTNDEKTVRFLFGMGVEERNRKNHLDL